MLATVARPEGRQTTGCYLDRTLSGRFRVCFRWQRPAPYRITLPLMVSSDSDERMAIRVRDLVGAEIRAGIFDPAARFPAYFAPKLSMPKRGGVKRLGDEMAAWIARVDVPGVRRGRIRNYKNDLDNYFRKHELGTRDADRLTIDDLEAFKRWLVTKAGEDGDGVSEKTAANAIRGTLRAFLRDTRRATTLLDGLRWERVAPTRRQEPLETDDVRRIIRWFRAKRPFGEYVSVALRFQGVTPSEARGLEVGDFSRRTSSLTISRSNYGGDTGATKTRARDRVVLLDRGTAAAVAKACGIRKPGERLLAVRENALVDVWRRALTSLGIGYRSIYQAKHSYAVGALEGGENPSDVARNLGISLATLEKHYAASIRRRTERRGNSKENSKRGVSRKTA